ncbi:Keratin, type I cytoskeletal [Merluccius polli]|uniref:Keratin, type I cytoskeletal n=1 Tax=Merluccius polli TaxID=89951 RepID=A0AA47N2L7_MERPO|nr:Keratin, type I cytoskeletal [Merluccius polli]
MSFTNRLYTQRTSSVYGGAGGRGTRISIGATGGGLVQSSPGGFCLSDGLDLHVGANEKATMQNLNDRLASYLEKVRTLEKENNELEKKIREWYMNKTVVCHDHSHYLATIKDLKDKICFASSINAKVILEIDNTKLAADDFQMKFANEQSMRLAVEADSAGLRRGLDELNMNRMDLENQYESLKVELIMLQENHKEEMASFRSRVGGQVEVSVDASPSPDLNKAMSEVREYYESLIIKNRKELETWYQSKMTEVTVIVEQESENLRLALIELKELKITLQRLQIELQSNISMGTLVETQGRFTVQLSGLQFTVTSLEEQLSQLHANIISHRQEYDMLLDLKTRLELEIKEYRRLLDGEDESHKQVVTKIITVVETVVDGKVVESSKTVDVDVDEQ